MFFNNFFNQTKKLIQHNKKLTAEKLFVFYKER